VHLPLELSDQNKMVLCPGCKGHARCNLWRKNVQSVRFIINKREYCSNLSVGTSLNVEFTTNKMLAKNNTDT